MIYHKTILVVEDDPNDRFFMERAFRQNGVSNSIHFVGNGLEAISYLEGEGQYRDREKFGYPTFILMDLKMPRADGFALIESIKKNPAWATIPTVVFTSSDDPGDIKRAYRLGASFYHAKPSSYDELQRLLKILHNYWMTCKVPDPLLTFSRSEPPAAS